MKIFEAGYAVVVPTVQPGAFIRTWKLNGTYLGNKFKRGKLRICQEIMSYMGKTLVCKCAKLKLGQLMTPTCPPPPLTLKAVTHRLKL